MTAQHRSASRGSATSSGRSPIYWWRANLPFLWDVSIPGSDYPELKPKQVALSQQMVGYWTSFARTGDPNARGSVPWAELTPEDGVVQSLSAGDGGIGPVPFAENHRCQFWLG